MSPDDARRERQHNQRLSGAPFSDPVPAIAWFGAVQSQDHLGAKWGVAQRCGDAAEAELDALFDAGAFLRVHVLRPTWHYVLPEDLGWMLRLSAARVKAKAATNDRKLGLDERIFARSNDVLGRLAAEGPFTREDASAALSAAGIALGENRLSHLTMRAELEGVLCSGPLRGKQHTWALVSDRVRAPRDLRGDEALAELVRRYFQSHAPATARDFAWWSGLTTTDAKRGIAAAGLESVAIDGRIAYRVAGQEPPRAPKARTAHLLPNFDEYVVAYVDRDGGFDPMKRIAHVIVVDGAFVGLWRRTVGKREVTVELEPVEALDDPARAAIGREAERYGRFLGLEVRVR